MNGRGTVGGPLGMQQLGELLGHRSDVPPPPPHAAALRDAVDSRRRASAALQAVSHPAAAGQLIVGHARRVVADALRDLERIA